MISSNLAISGNESPDNELLYIFSKIGQKPHRISLHDLFIREEFDKALLDLSPTFVVENFQCEMTPRESGYNIHEKNLIKIGEDIWISFTKFNPHIESCYISDIFIYFKNIESKEYLNRFIEALSKCSIKYDSELSKISSISLVNSTLDLEPLQAVDDIDCYYSKKNSKEIKKMIKDIRDNEKGISIIRGNRGLGKTTAAKYISSKLDKMSIFIPINMIDHTINNAEFRNFLQRFEKCMIVIDDCEFIYPLSQKFSYVTSNILQLVDGFLSDTIHLHFLLIFNEGHVDQSLTNSNNFISLIEFEELNEKEASKLAKKLDLKVDIEGSMRLVDIISGKKINNPKVGLH